MSNTEQQPKRVERQIKLPTSKAVEIAWKSIRLRLSRSLVVTSGIILALAFLMYILSSDQRHRRHAQLDRTVTPRRAEIRRQARSQCRGTPAQGAAAASEQLIAGRSSLPADAAGTASTTRRSSGKEFAEIQKELGPLPVSPDALKKLLTAEPTWSAPCSSGSHSTAAAARSQGRCSTARRT